MNKEMYLSRRGFFRVAAGGAALLLPRGEVEAQKEGEPVLLDKQGFHAAPDSGGGKKVDQQIDDIIKLGGTSVTVMNPTEEYVGKAADAHLQVIARLHFNSVDDVEKITREQLAIHRGIQFPLFQIGNELNAEMFGGVMISPSDFHKQVFYPVAKATIAAGGTALIPPMSQDTPVDEFAYLEELLQLAKSSLPAEAIGISIHNYFQPGENPFNRIRKINNLVKENFSENPSLYITETGLHQSDSTFYPDSIVQRETLRAVQMQIPSDLRVMANNWWLLGNSVFRGPPLPEHTKIFDEFDRASWRRSESETTPVYNSVATLAQTKGKVKRPGQHIS